MKVLLVCMSGITTNVLADKLRKYAEEKGYPDTFSACKMGIYLSVLPSVDVVLIAPQAKLFSNNLKENAAKFQIPVLELTEEDLVFSKVEKVYVNLNGCRKPDRVYSPKKHLTFKDVGNILINSMIYCIPLLMLGFFSWMLFQLTKIWLFSVLFQISIGIIGLYMMFLIGYHYGSWEGTDALSCAALSVGAPLIVLPTSNLTYYQNQFIRLTNGYIPVESLGIHNSLLLIVLSVLTILLLDKLKNIKLKKHSFSNVMRMNLLEHPLEFGSIFVVFLCIRVMIEKIL